MSDLQTEDPVNLAQTVFNGRCSVGAYSYFNYGCEVSDASIGRFCSVGQQVLINPGAHPTHCVTTHPIASDPSGVSAGMRGLQSYKSVAMTAMSVPATRERVEIGHDVWLGARSIIMGGVEIGTGAIVAAGAVVTKSVAPFEIVGGVPAKHIKLRFDSELVARLLESHWWSRDLSRMPSRDFSDPWAFLAELDRFAPQ